MAAKISIIISWLKKNQHGENGQPKKASEKLIGNGEIMASAGGENSGNENSNAA
jgi:hypothetical protein